MSEQKVNRLFRELWSNQDARKNQVAAEVMMGAHTWLEKGTLESGFTPESFKTRAITEGRAAEQGRAQAAS